MKKVILLAAGLFFAFSTFAQQTDNKQPVKKIEVNGSAEMEITPDIIYIDISLKEYLKNKTNKVSITTLEKQLQKAVQDAGIAKEDFTIENVEANNYRILNARKKDDKEFLAGKQFRLKLSKLDKINAILASVDADGIERVNVSSYSHTKMEEYRKEVKIKALQAAKAKADYLLAAIDEKMGGVIEIQEINTDRNVDFRATALSNVAMYKSADTATEDFASADFKTIKVRAEVNATFSIQ